MIKSKNCNFFLSIGTNDIKFEAIDNDNEIFFSKNALVDNLFNTRDFEILEKFLKNNIFDIEKELSNYVENINLVVDHNDFLFVRAETFEIAKDTANKELAPRFSLFAEPSSFINFLSIVCWSSGFCPLRAGEIIELIFLTAF